MTKLTSLILISCSIFSVSAYANIPAACYAKAEAATEKFADSYYDKNGFSAYDCAIAPNGGAVICDVSASKGDGAAIDGYRAVLSLDCKKVYRVELTSEE